MAPSFDIEQLVLPSSADSPDAADFLEFSELSDALILETWGNLDLSNPREARLESWRDDDYKQARFYSSASMGAWWPGRVSGCRWRRTSTLRWSGLMF